MALARLLHAQGRTQEAFDALLRALDHAPQASPLIAPLLAQYAQACGQQAAALDKLLGLYRGPQPSLDVLDAIVSLQQPDAAETARDWYVQHLEKEPSLVAAAKWIAGEKLEHEQFHPQVQRALDHAVKPLTRYRCAACGFEAKQHFWQCPGCQTWDSYPARRVEEL
jgi:lipopolysaccharide biosynthesis regulator YciM